MTQPPAPPFDDELARALDAAGLVSTVTLDGLLASRAEPAPAAADAVLAERGLVREDHRAPGLTPADPDVTVSVIRKRSGPAGGPGIYFAHGGGMVVGDRFGGLDRVLDWVEALEAVLVSVEYRRAPDHPDPAPLHDCYAGLAWTAAQAGTLGFDPDRLVAAGLSAGAGLVAGAALMARDRGGPRLAGQVLMAPMLDDRDRTVSSRQMVGVGVWDRASNVVGWDALLGSRRGGDDVSPYSAPARATDLSGLPPTYVDCGSAEVFRDEAVAYASGIWAAGGVAELHIWAGGFHGFDGFAPDAAVSVAARRCRLDFLRRLGPATPGGSAR